MFKCPYYRVIKFSLSKFIKHLQFVHQQSLNFSITCVLSLCITFQICWMTDKACIQKASGHRWKITNDSDYRELVVESANCSNVETDDEFSDLSQCEAGTSNDSEGMSAASMLSALQKHLALFVLKLPEKHNLAKNVRSAMADDLKCVLVVSHRICVMQVYHLSL